MSDVVSLHIQTSPITTTDAPTATTFADLPDDLHEDIFLRSLPPWLMPVSEVCRRWHRLATSGDFLHTLRARHNDTPPLIGVFHNYCHQEGIQRFIPTGTGDAAMAAAAAFGCQTSWRILDCRHGRVLFVSAAHGGRHVLVLWDPMVRSCESLLVVSDLGGSSITGALVCPGGDCRSCPFLVVVQIWRKAQVMVTFFSSDSGEWSDMVTYKELPKWADAVHEACVVMGTKVYQPMLGRQALSFDPESKSFAMIPYPVPPNWLLTQVRIMRLAGDVLGAVAVDNRDFSMDLWARQGEGWDLRWKVQVNTLGKGCLRHVKVLGVCENGNFIILWTRVACFMLHLDSMELKELPIDQALMLGNMYPYQSFFTRPCVLAQNLS